MKKIGLYSVWVGIFLMAAACANKEPVPSSTDIFGQWRLEKMVGGLTGHSVVYPNPPIIDSFKQDSSFQRCTGGNCPPATKYFMRTEKSLITGKQERILTIQKRIYLAPPDTGYSLLNDRYRIIELGDNLTIDQDRPEGYTNFYHRI